MNGSQFQKRFDIKSGKTVARWYEKGYLGNATKDEKGIYSIPEDVVLPYSANARVSTLEKLWRDIFRAANKCQAIYPSMYPKFSNGIVEGEIKKLAESGYIEYGSTQSGCRYLKLNFDHYADFKKLTDRDQLSAIDGIVKMISNGTSVTSAFIQILAKFGI